MSVGSTCPDPNEHDVDEPITATLRPSPVVAGRWTGVGTAATALAVWVALDARTSLVAWVFAALCLVVTSYVAVQVVAPRWFTVVLGPAAIEARLLWQRHRVPWDRIHLARVVRVAGEPVLELHVWDPDDVARTRPRAVGLVLPVGVDQSVLHRVLEQRLGRHHDTPDGVSTASG